MFVENMLSVLVFNDIQIPQNLLKFMDSLNRKPALYMLFQLKISLRPEPNVYQ